MGDSSQAADPTVTIEQMAIGVLVLVVILALVDRYQAQRERR